MSKAHTEQTLEAQALRSLNPSFLQRRLSVEASGMFLPWQPCRQCPPHVTHVLLAHWGTALGGPSTRGKD
jgi:hypothetical protein